MDAYCHYTMSAQILYYMKQRRKEREMFSKIDGRKKESFVIIKEINREENSGWIRLSLLYLDFLAA